MIIIDSKRFSPVIHANDVPWEDDYYHLKPGDITKEFLEKGDYVIDDEWWRIQNDRCINGFEVKNAISRGGDAIIDGDDAIWKGNDCYLPQYDLLIRDKTVWISGRYYFYLNFWWIYGLIYGSTVKKYIRPRFLLLDYLFDRRLIMMKEQSKDLQELKARQLGFSEKLAGMVLGYNYTFIDGSQNIVVAGEQTDADKTFYNTKNGLNELMNTQFYKTRSKSGDRSDYVESKYTKSWVKALTARDNVQTISRFTPTVVVFEEVGKGKKEWSIDTAEYAKPGIWAEGVKTGDLIYIGTGGSMEEGVHDLEERHYNPDEYNILSFKNKYENDVMNTGKVGHFTGKQWFTKVDVDGNPLFKESFAFIKEGYEQSKPENRYKYIIGQARYASEAFMTSSEGFFGENKIRLLNERLTYIRLHREAQIERVGVLEPIDPNNYWKGMKFVTQHGGWLHVIEEPELDEKKQPIYNLYEMGTDSYDQDIALTSKSKGAFYVRKKYNPFTKSPFFNQCVAEVVERPVEGAEAFYRHSVMVCIWYNCQNNIEYANLRIFDFYIVNGFEVLLKPSPQLALARYMSRDTKISNKYGTDKTLKPAILAITSDALTETYIGRMFFPRQIKALAQFRYDPGGKKYNCDITMATAEAEVAAKESELVAPKKKEEGESLRGYRFCYKDRNGILKYKMS